MLHTFEKVIKDAKYSYIDQKMAGQIFPMQNFKELNNVSGKWNIKT